MILKKLMSALIAAICLTEPVLAFKVTASHPLSEAIGQAQIIVVARVITYTPDAEAVRAQAEQRRNRGSGPRILDADGLVNAVSLQSAGQYKVQIIQSVKGEEKVGDILQLNLPQISAHYYNYAHFQVLPGNRVLLLLQQTGQSLSPVDPTLPLLKLSGTARPSQGDASAVSVSHTVVSLLLASLHDTELRKSHAYLLRDVADPLIPPALIPYQEDPDLNTRDSVLFCLATNQVVTAIPRIAQLERSLHQENSGSEAVAALQAYTKPEAASYLNPLLLEQPSQVRLNASFALRVVADQKSVPYLFLALKDPDATTAYSAYLTLHRLLPTLGFPRSSPEFEKNRDQALQPLYEWWEDELSGKHPAPWNLVSERAKNSAPAAAPRVLALYYGWYGMPPHTPQLQHFTGINTTTRTIASQPHYPQVGPSDSTDPEVLARHVREAKQAGIDTLVCSWWGKGDQTDRSFRALLPLAVRAGLTVCPLYERNPRPGNIDAVRQDWEYILQEYGQSPAFLKLEGKPVFFVYGNSRSQLSTPQWAQLLEDMKHKNTSGVAVIADGADALSARVFDGLSLLDPTSLERVEAADTIPSLYKTLYGPLLSQAASFHRVPLITVMPGYDERSIVTGQIGAYPFGTSLERSRGNGSLYRAEWEWALAHPGVWVVINSFNQWHTGTEIEPSLEFSDTYLMVTGQYARRLKGLTTNLTRVTP